MDNTLIITKELKKSFFTKAGRLDVLKDIDIKIRKGEFVAITGASGAGKSTLLHILGTLDRPTSGTVLHNNRDIFGLDDETLSHFRNRHIGFVFQFHHLLPEFSALENTLMPGLIAGEDRKKLLDATGELFSRLGVYNRRDHRPGELSGGEQQRVAVARALVLNPEVVFADEPTGNLDTATGNELFRTLKDLNEDMGITFVMVTHNEVLANKCNRILHMTDGLIAERE